MSKQRFISGTLAFVFFSCLTVNLLASAADEAGSKKAGSQVGDKTKSAKEASKSDKAAEDAKEKGSDDKSKMTKASGLQVNDRAPDVSLPNQHGKTISLSEYRGKKVVVLYFYPKDDTPVCTAESCSFRDSYDAFKELGAEVIGVSNDSVESHKKFADKHRLQFHLLADTSGMARKAFGVPTSMKILPGRVTYVIDKDGVIRYVFNSMSDGPKHVTEAMKIVKDLNAPAKS
ncbi:MAG: peroxiredoxin [Candidatus Obscuribacterales bacterium]|jgi:peroxiredoxin Q/BCP|nr:peroxiredoxin [Candidatus Obscuribacterales bacterium]